MPQTELWLSVGTGAAWYALNMLTRVPLAAYALVYRSPWPLVLPPALWFFAGGWFLAARCRNRVLWWMGLSLVVAWLLEVALLQGHVMEALGDPSVVIGLVVQAAAALLGVFVGGRIRRRA
jgi:hypothetical protein